VHSADGLDEVSIAAPTTAFDFTPAGMRQFTIQPRAADNDQPFQLADIVVASAQASADCIRQLAAGTASAAIQYAVALNAGVALYAANRIADYATGVAQVEAFLQTNQLAKYLETL
jgi:anthranilate phosphoribosyltransferase